MASDVVVVGYQVCVITSATFTTGNKSEASGEKEMPRLRLRDS